MADYKPSLPFTTPLEILIPTVTTVKGSEKKIYPDTGELIFCSFKTYGGTERESNGVYIIEDTANIETWYRPDITSDCRVKIAGTEKCYDIIGEPENINMRNQYLKFKIRRVIGGA